MRALRARRRGSRDASGTPRPPCPPAPTSPCCPAASPTATTCAAAPSPAGRAIMDAVRAHAARGGLVLGICNGFQILCESGLLPGVLMRNAGLSFICHRQHLRVERADTPSRGRYRQGQVDRRLRRPRRGQLHRRRRDAGPPRRRGPGRLPLLRRGRAGDGGRQPQRLAERHRRHLLARPQRARADAAPREPDRRRSSAERTDAGCSRALRRAAA